MPIPPRWPYRRYPKPPPEQEQQDQNNQYQVHQRSVTLRRLGSRAYASVPAIPSKQLIQTAGADTVFGLLVFVHLLVGDAQVCSKFMLAHAQRSSPLSQPHSNVDINRVRPTPPAATGRFCPHQGTPS